MSLLCCLKVSSPLLPTPGSGAGINGTPEASVSARKDTTGPFLSICNCGGYDRRAHTTALEMHRLNAVLAIQDDQCGFQSMPGHHSGACRATVLVLPAGV